MVAKGKKKTSWLPKGSWLVAGFLGLLLIVSLLAAFYFIFLRSGYAPPEPQDLRHHKSTEIRHQSTPHRIILPKSKKHKFLAKVAIVIDDIGNQKKLALDIMNIDLNLSFSILPNRPFSQVLAKKAGSLGRDILLHIPMEPQDHKWNPGKGALLLSMSREQIITTMEDDIAQVPMAIGVNNHMGSAFTENRAAMGIFLNDLRHKNLFWLDSLTSPKSVGFEMSGNIGLPTAKRGVFLDNIQKSARIIRQLDKLLNLARRRGYAIGIAHPHPETLKALKRYQYTLRQEVQLVGIHQILGLVK